MLPQFAATFPLPRGGGVGLLDARLVARALVDRDRQPDHGRVLDLVERDAKLIALNRAPCSRYGRMPKAQVRRWSMLRGVVVADAHPADRERALDVVIVVHRQAELLEVVHALGPPGRLAGGLDGRQEQGDQDRDDRDDDQELDQRERGGCPSEP